MISLYSSAFFPMAEKRERNRETDLERQKGSGWAYREPSLLPFASHGGVELAYVGGHLGVPTKPRM
jgi:hypothetical protein